MEEVEKDEEQEDRRRSKAEGRPHTGDTTRADSSSGPDNTSFFLGGERHETDGRS